MRKAGCLIPVSSLPSRYGIGDFGPSSYELVDLLVKCGFSIWQILPLNPLGFGNSPYQTFSSKAMDEIYLSLDVLKEDGLLDEVKPYRARASKVEYDRVRKYKEPYLKKAFSKFQENEEYKEFTSQKWVKEYAVFASLKQIHGGKCWNQWPKEHKDWIYHQCELPELDKEIRYRMFLQYMLYHQWKRLRTYANDKGIEIMGDVPFYVGIDSLDVWGYQEGFLLDEQGEPTFVAGVAPDCFSAEGQRWGNPIYDWNQHQKDGFSFWLDRLSYNSTLYDIVRIDHFRAFDTYWKIPRSCPTAVEGAWIEAPGYKLFEALYQAYPDINIIAEDLGDLRPQVIELRDHFKMMGMRIVQHSFHPNDDMPMDQENLCAYTGTHDNESIRVWYMHAGKDYRKDIWKFFKRNHYLGHTVSENMIQYTLESKSRIAILPMVDLLNKNDSCRLNFPGTVGNPNWQWKLKDYHEFEQRASWIRNLIQNSKRLPEHTLNYDLYSK